MEVHNLYVSLQNHFTSWQRRETAPWPAFLRQLQEDGVMGRAQLDISSCTPVLQTLRQWVQSDSSQK